MIISDLDDYILPSQTCINPFVGTTSPSPSPAAPTAPSEEAVRSKARGASNRPGGAVRLNLGSDLGYEDSREGGRLKSTGVGVIKAKGGANDVKVATVALTDCLACSGCVTSAEAVLIQNHSHQKLAERLAVSGAYVVVTLSPQSVASIANLLGLAFADCFRVLSTALKACGVRYVFDAASGGDVALLEAREQFVRRYKAGIRNLWSAPPYSIAVSSVRESVVMPSGELLTRTYEGEDLAGIGVSSKPAAELPLPMLCSHCPGWVCYAEKTQPQSLPYIDSTKSSQQIIGAVFKRLILSRFLPSVAVSDVYHVAIMPCFDKKLEATRKDFYHDDIACSEVDLVLSTVELINFIVSSRASLAPGDKDDVDVDMESEGGDAVEAQVNASIVSAKVRDTLGGILHSVRARRPLDALRGVDEVEALFRHASEDGLTVVSAADSNGSSGGYLEYIYRYAAEVLFNDNIWSEPIEYVVGRNDDFAELSVRGGDDRPCKKLKFARAYGFRNIQSVMMKMKTKRCSYDFVEIMACPKGCANGGGQPKAQERETPSATRDRVLAVVGRMAEVVVASPDDSPLVQWLRGLGGRHEWSSLLHTRYHAVPKLEELAPLATANKW